MFFYRIYTINGIKADIHDRLRLITDYYNGKVKVIFYNGYNVITE